MPYIEKVKRDQLQEEGVKIETPGELNYSLTILMIDFMETSGETYTNYNTIIGMLNKFLKGRISGLYNNYRMPLRKSLYDNSDRENLYHSILSAINEYINSNYGTISLEELEDNILGALDAAKMEFYRRKVVFYEDKKIKENSDVY